MTIAMGWKKPDNVAGSSIPAVMIGLFVASGGLLFGYDTGAINGILAMAEFRKQFSTGYVDPSDGLAQLSPAESSTLVAMLSAGTILGALLAAPIGDWIGRRISLLVCCFVFCVGGIIQVCADVMATMLVGRFIAGVAVGGISVLVPVYQAEMSPKWIRGTLVCAYQLSITIGLLSASVVNIFTSRLETSAAFRIPLGLQLVWAGVLTLGMLVLPETPRYLVKRGMAEQAGLSLSRLRRLDLAHPALMDELQEIVANHEYELTLGADSYKDVFFGTPHLGRRLVTGCGVQVLQQLTGINFIMYYSTTFFNGAGVEDPYTKSLIIQIINAVSTIPGLVVIETWGRRKLLMIGSVGMALCQLLIASFSAAAGDHLQSEAQTILIVFCAIFIFFFAASWGPVAWVITAEIYPLKTRAKANSISTASNWMLNFAISYSTPYLVGDGVGTAELGPKVFFVWGAFCIVGIIFVWCMVYETSKLSLEQIDEMYERVNHAWNSTSFQPSWSFQQILDEGWSPSGHPDHELTPTSSNESATPPPTPPTPPTAAAMSTSVAAANQSAEAQIVAGLGNVSFSY